MKRSIDHVYAKEPILRKIKQVVIQPSEYSPSRNYINAILRLHNKTIAEFCRTRVSRDSEPESHFGIHEAYIAYVDWLAACTPPHYVDRCCSDIVETLLKKFLNQMCGPPSRVMWVGWKIIYHHFGFDSTAIRKKANKPMSLLWDNAVDHLRIVDQDENGIPNSKHNWRLELIDGDILLIQMTRVILLGDKKDTYLWRCSTYSSKWGITGIDSDPNIHAAKKKSILNFLTRYESRFSSDDRVRYINQLHTALKGIKTNLEAKHSEAKHAEAKHAEAKHAEAKHAEAKHAEAKHSDDHLSVQFAFLPQTKPIQPIVLKPII